MAAADVVTFPRLVYRGDADKKGSYEGVETREVADQDAFDEIEKDGWRLTRVPDAKAKAAANAKPDHKPTVKK